MRILMPFMFLLFALVGGLGVLFVNSGGTFGSSTSSERISENSEPSGLSLVLGMLSGDSETSAAAPAAELSGALAAYLPAAGPGWTREGYKMAHGEVLTETTYQQSNVPISDTNNLLSIHAKAARDPNGAAATYRKGDQTVIVSLRFEDDDILNGSLLGMMTMQFDEVERAMLIGSGTMQRSTRFASVHGIPFEFGPDYSRVLANSVRVPVAYRSLSAEMGEDLAIRVLTNASDAAIAEVIAGIDIPGLNGRLPNPDMIVTAGTGLITSERAALATQPPEPSMQYKAFHRLRADVSDLSQDDVRLLQEIANGNIKGWIDIYENYGLHYRLSSAMTEVLGEKPELAPIDQVRFEAMTMLQNPAVLARYEIDIVRGLATGRYETREKAQRQLSETRLYSPPLIRLINKLPLAPVEEVATPDIADDSVVATAPPPREIVVRRGITVQQGEADVANCAIELGVRRCSLEDDTQ